MKLSHWIVLWFAVVAYVGAVNAQEEVPDEAALAAGRALLKRVKDDVLQSNGSERILGFFIGRKCVGSATLRVVRGTPEETGGWVADFQATFRLGEYSSDGRGHESFSEAGALLESNGTATYPRKGPEAGEQTAVSLRDGRFVGTSTKRGRTTEFALEPREPFVAGTLDFLLPRYVDCRTPGRVQFWTLSESAGAWQLESLGIDTGPKAIHHDGEVVQGYVVLRSGPRPARYLYDFAGRFLEGEASDFRLQHRPIARDALDQDLAFDQAELSAPSRAVLDLFLAIAAADAERIVSAFDFDQMIDEMNREAGKPRDSDANERSEKVDFMKSIISPAMLALRATLPNAETLALIWPAMSWEESAGDEAWVSFGGRRWMKLRRLQDAWKVVRTGKTVKPPTGSKSAIAPESK